jgi:predicted dehydrogenase
MGLNTESPIPLRRHTLNVFNEKVKAFVVAIQEGKPAPIPGEQIVRNQAVIDGILRSAAEKREVSIDVPEI